MNTMHLHFVTGIELAEITNWPKETCEHGKPWSTRDLLVSTKSGGEFRLTLFADKMADLIQRPASIPPITQDHEKAGWLQTLISSYDQEHNWSGDPDPDATREMLAWCRLILDEMAGRLPPVPEPAMTNAHSDLPF